MAGAPYDDDRQRVDQADDDALVQHARDGRNHAGRAARAGRREPEELRLRAARRHLLGRLPFDLLSRRRSCSASANASSKPPRNADVPVSHRIAPHRALALRAASLQSRSGVAREDIVAARRERRQKAKAARAVRPGRRRAIASGADATSGVAVEESLGGRRGDRSARRARSGLHDAALEQGHEEIPSTSKTRKSSRGRRALRTYRRRRLGSRLRGGSPLLRGALRLASPEPSEDSALRRSRLREEQRVSARYVRDDRRRVAISHQTRGRLVRRAARRHRRLARGAPLELLRQPDNPHDRTRSRCTTGNSSSVFSISGSRRTSHR